MQILTGKDDCRKGSIANESPVFSEKHTEALNTVNYHIHDELLSVHGVTGWKIESTYTEILKKEIPGKDLVVKFYYIVKSSFLKMLFGFF